MNTQFLSRVFLFSLLVLVGCAPHVSDPPQAILPMLGTNTLETSTLTPFQPMPVPSATQPPGLWFETSAPAGLIEQLRAQGLVFVDTPSIADLQLKAVDHRPSEPVSTWVYVLVAAFPTVRDGVTFAELKERWSGGQGLVMTADTYAAMQELLGPAAGSGPKLVQAGEVTASLWGESGSWGIVPFELLDPKLKVLAVDGISPVHKEFDLDAYPLKIFFVLEPPLYKLPGSNRDPDQLVTVLMTGTTALVRAISYKMQQNGIEYPARDIGDWLRSADIFHTSSEVAFTPDCPAPDPYDGHLGFCSALENIGLLDAAGVDVIELSGNHVNDWGVDALRYTLDLYTQRGWPVFAGGADQVAARQPAILERAGIRFAFLGCNTPGPEFAWSTYSTPGAARCGDYAWLVDEIRRQKASGAVVIVALQHYEYYTSEPRPLQREDFRRLAEAGADLVSGSQAHFSQSMEFHKGVFIHYGLGNLFFDQMEHDYGDGTSTTDIRREFLDRHVFYAGRLVSTELLTAVNEDFSKPRPMTPEERQDFLMEYFIASGWLP